MDQFETYGPGYCQLCGEEKEDELSDFRWSAPRPYYVHPEERLYNPRIEDGLRACYTCYRKHVAELAAEIRKGARRHRESFMREHGCQECIDFRADDLWPACFRGERPRLISLSRACPATGRVEK